MGAHKVYFYLISSVLCTIFSVQDIVAQDFYYSQYELTPHNINPSLLSSEKDIKLSMHYHQNELWKELKMRNFQMSLTHPLNFIKNERKPQVIGVTMVHNNTGKNGLVNCTGGSLTFTQGVAINRWSILSAGLQASYFLYSKNNPGNYTTGSQWIDGTGYDPNQGIDEIISFETIKLFTVSAGINWEIKEGSIPKGGLGISAYNLNKPKYSLLNEKNKLGAKYIIHGNYRLFKAKNISITPRVLFIYQNVNLVSFGALFSYSLKNDNPFLLIKDCNLQFGLDYRYNHSGIVSLSVEQSKYIFGISYAIGLNNDRVYSNYSSNIEICFAFKFHKQNKHVVKPNEYNIGETRLIFIKGIEKNQVAQNEKPDSLNNYRSDSLVVAGEKYRVQLRQDFKFKFNDATLTEDSQAYLDDLAKMLKQNLNLKVEVIGHTDDVGTEKSNLIISEKRAKNVIDYLKSKGIDGYRLKLTSKGGSEPIVPNNSEENKGKNRRVEFIIYSE